VGYRENQKRRKKRVVRKEQEVSNDLFINTEKQTSYTWKVTYPRIAENIFKQKKKLMP